MIDIDNIEVSLDEDGPQSGFSERAADKYIANDRKDGDVTPTSWFESALDIPAYPSSGERKDHQQWEVTFLKRRTDFFRHMAEEHKIQFRAVIGIGYQQISAADAISVAVDELQKTIKRGYKKARLRLNNLRDDSMTNHEKNRLADAKMKLDEGGNKKKVKDIRDAVFGS